MAACPYGARSFNWFDPRKKLDTAKINPLYPTRSKGVVEKCNFCSELLARGEKPKCVEASNGAIAFGDLDDPNSEVVRLLRTVYAIRRKSELGTEPSVFYIIR
jgi:molybdopterin-containing oxidoreductase family iron-sulfur binding subunit